MNNPHVFLQDDGLDLLTEPVKKFAEMNKYQLTCLTSTDMRHLNKLPRHRHGNDPLLIIGSFALVRDSFVSNSCKPSLPDCLQNFTPDRWAELFGKNYLNSKGVVRNVGQLFSQWHGFREPLFIRDNSVFKQFIGGLYTRREFRTLVSSADLSMNYKLWACTTDAEKGLEEEYSVAVVDGKIVSIILSKMNGLMRVTEKINPPLEVASFVKEQVIPIFPEKEYVVNVGTASRHGNSIYRSGYDLAIVDFNILNSFIWPDAEIADLVYTRWMEAILNRREEKKDESTK